jgi:DNA-binding transcriptional regulator LsrR (DeoR family)
MTRQATDVETGPESEGASSDSHAALVARICWHYYKEGQTQDVIAQHLKITRKRVNQILGEARESGVVQITIASPTGPCSEFEARLVAKFGLRTAIVVPSPIGETDVRNLIGAAAGHYISEHLPSAGTLGITWGGTINMAAQNLKRRSDDGCRVVLLCGGLAESTAINPYDNAAMMARALGARCYYVTAPMFAPTEQLRDALVASEPVRSVLAMVAELDIALFSAIDLSEQSKALEYGVISRETWQSLRKAGAVGDICGHYLDSDGNVVSHPLTRRVIHPAMSDLAAVRERVLAAGGLQKVPIIRAAIRARLADVLITDEQAAIALCEAPATPAAASARP